jgi:STE24 endopeptidase
MNAASLLLVLVFLLPITWSLVEGRLAWMGDRSPELRARVFRYFTEEDIERGTEYRRAFIPGSVASELVFWGLLAWLVLGNGGRRLADRAGMLSGGNFIVQVLLVALALALLFRLIRFPITFYHGYLLEGTFGFRRLDFLPWLWRLLKGWAIGGGMEVLVAIAFFFTIRRFPDRWLPISIAGGAAITYILTVSWHAIFLPMFYQVSPLPPGPLRDGVAELAARAGVPVQEIRLVDQSRVSGHTNAFFAGIGGRREIYLFDTLSEQHDVPEVLAVVAHEIGHWRHQHVLKGWAIGVATMALGFTVLYFLLRSPAFLAAAGARGPTDPALIPVLWALMSAGTIAVAPFGNAVSRHYERQADRAAIELIPDPQIFVTMKVDAARANRSNLTPHPVLVFWNATHPPVIERIEMAAAAIPERVPAAAATPAGP